MTGHAGRPHQECASPAPSITSCLFDHRQDVAGRVFEPRDVRAATAEDAPLVGPEGLFLVALEPDAGSGQLVHRPVDVIDGEVEDGECRRGRGWALDTP